MKVKPTLALIVIAVTSNMASAYYGLGGCPKNYPKISTPFGASGSVPDGIYYTHMFDFSYYGQLEGKLTAAQKPVEPRDFMMCR